MNIRDGLVIGGSAGLAAWGLVGGYIFRSMSSSVSPVGVALTCGLTTAIALSIIRSRQNVPTKFVSLLATYPVSLLAVNAAVNVRLLDPIISVVLGTVIVIPAVICAGCCSLIPGRR